MTPAAKRDGAAEWDIRLSAMPHTSVWGQPGNTNALKHGFYTKNFSLTERRGLQEIEGVVLSDEIGLLRVLIRRLS